MDADETLINLWLNTDPDKILEAGIAAGKLKLMEGYGELFIDTKMGCSCHGAEYSYFEPDAWILA